MGVTLESYLKRRVQRGAMWLDLTRPGWYRQVNLVRLNLRDQCQCIVGQLAASAAFFEVVHSIVPIGTDYGVAIFNHKRIGVRWIEHEISVATEDWVWSILTRLWTVEINDRLRLWEESQADRVPTKRERQQKTQRTEWAYTQST